VTAQVEDVESAVANGAGVATVLFSINARLTIDSLAILVTGSTALPTVTVYDGTTPTAGRVRSSSRIGDRNTFTGTGDVLYPGQSLTVQWTGCTPGAICNAILRGQR
jgi:hypothetical protein